MAGVEDADVIDLVAQDAQGEYMVVMIETRPWGADPHQAEQLKEKINAYAGYVLSGDFVRQYPEAADEKVRIQLDCLQSPSGEIATVADWADRELQERGIRFVVNARTQAV